MVLRRRAVRWPPPREQPVCQGQRSGGASGVLSRRAFEAVSATWKGRAFRESEVRARAAGSGLVEVGGARGRHGGARRACEAPLPRWRVEVLDESARSQARPRRRALSRRGANEAVGLLHCSTPRWVGATALARRGFIGSGSGPRLSRTASPDSARGRFCTLRRLRRLGNRSRELAA